VKVHLADKARVDQDVPGVAATEVKTRKVIVVEVEEKNRGLGEDITKRTVSATNDVSGTSKVVTQAPDALVVHEVNFTFPERAAGDMSSPAGGDVQTYTVLKDDTLQKIARKFYGSYNKWTRIYEFNKDVIKDPNFVKPGVVLKVPVEVKPVDGTPETKNP
jgi:nucleoid-associated protein YgaU